MNLLFSQISLLAAALVIAAMPAWAGLPPEQQVGTISESSLESTAPTFSQQDLDQALAPIALYPDDLLAQILMASTYPLEIVQAARWQSANPDVKDKALQDAMEQQPWDPSVKALTSVPQVLKQMNDKIDWTQKLGDIFLAQKGDVMTTVQQLRAKAYAEGNLKSTAEQNVKVEPWPETATYESTTPKPEKIYIIESAQPEVVYVPTYSPSVVYGPWWYSSPPYYMYPPSYVYPPGVAFTAGLIVGGAIWGNSNWGYGDVDIDVDHHNSSNRTNNITNKKWEHKPEHRKGVSYQDRGVGQKYNRGANTRDVQSREQFRGRGDQGRNSVGTSDRMAGSSDRGLGGRDSGDRGLGGRDGGNRGGGFSGIGSGASTRDASARGGSSRSSANRGGGASRSGGGGRSRGGGGGGRRR